MVLPSIIKDISTSAEYAPQLCSSIMNEMLGIKALSYVSRHELELAERLGSGKDGIVFVAKSNHRTDVADVAIKILNLEEAYLREKWAYERLKKCGVVTICGFYVPELVGYDDDLRVIAMTIVKKPYVLDFAAAYPYARYEFSEEIWAQWESDKREQFEEHWPMVQKILAAFEELGIYLMDVSPANIAFLD
jgi:hypothetical protein